MNYEEALAFIHSQYKFGNSPNLTRIKALLKALDDPQDSLKFIHIAGTNGKGSVCTLCSNILSDAGYNVGLFTSPFITDFCERIQYNGNMIGRASLARLTSKVKNVLVDLSQEGIKPTEFEVITAIAMLYFKEMECDIVVLETGLGGRFDATNVISSPLLSIITCIGMDHVSILGNSLEKIAFEKCGIIKDNGTTICYPCQLPKAFSVIESTCKIKNNNLIMGCLKDIEILNYSIDATLIKWNDVEINLKLIGEHQVINVSTAISAAEKLKKLGYKITDSNIKTGIEKTAIPARFEILSQEPLVILDGAHNADGIDSFVATLENLLPNKKKLFVVGTMRDKDYSFTIERIARASTEFIATTPNNPRSLFACNATEIAHNFCKRTAAIHTPSDAINYALFKAKKNDYAVIVCGSMYLAGDVRNTIVKKLP